MHKLYNNLASVVKFTPIVLSKDLYHALKALLPGHKKSEIKKICNIIVGAGDPTKSTASLV